MEGRDDIHYDEPASGHRLPHDPFNAIAGPRPIGWISSHDAQGRLNLAPYSFFNAFNYTPPVIGFASIGFARRRPGGAHNESALIRFQSKALGAVVMCIAFMQSSRRCGRLRRSWMPWASAVSMLSP